MYAADYDTPCLVQEMAAVLGLDLATQNDLGRLSDQEHTVMLRRCDLCAFVDPCIVWLSEQTGQVQAPPDFCQNRDKLAALIR